MNKLYTLLISILLIGIVYATPLNLPTPWLLMPNGTSCDINGDGILDTRCTNGTGGAGVNYYLSAISVDETATHNLWNFTMIGAPNITTNITDSTGAGADNYTTGCGVYGTSTKTTSCNATAGRIYNFTFTDIDTTIPDTNYSIDVAEIFQRINDLSDNQNDTTIPDTNYSIDVAELFSRVDDLSDSQNDTDTWNTTAQILTAAAPLNESAIKANVTGGTFSGNIHMSSFNITMTMGNGSDVCYLCNNGTDIFIARLP